MVAVAVLGGFAAVAQQPAKPLALPTPEQAAWHDFELGVFIHFAPNTWQDEEYDKRTTPLTEIDPAQLNTDEWVAAAESFGAKYIVFVAKHVGGFCMWQTDTTPYGIKNAAWRGGKGDVLKDLSESCKKRGMKLGVYLSPRDDTLGADTGGVCKTPEEQKKYDDIYRQQLTEILTRYGEITEVWFDGSTGIEAGDILKKHAPKAMFFQSKYATIRWVGNEDGFAPYPAWNGVSEAKRLAGATAKDGDPDGDAWLPNECDARIRRDWFYSSKNADTLKSIDDLLEMYYLSVGHGAVLLLNMTPDTTGRFPEADVKRLAEFGAEIKRRFGKSLAETSGEGEVVELSLSGPTLIDHVIAMEDITQGERVREYVIEGFVDGAWKELCKGTAIGHKKIDRIESSTVGKVRLRTTKAAAAPKIRKLAVYKTEE
jgi:alpha-L-fucosidase